MGKQVVAHIGAVPPTTFEQILPTRFVETSCKTRHSEALGGHALRVAAYSYAIARVYGFGEAAAKKLRQASIFHDIGKLLIPKKLLRKPTLLSPSEHLEIQGHTSRGADLLSASDTPILQKAASIALNHHEYLDGSGYPNQLSGAAIPLEARLVSVADVFDALTSERVYRPALSQRQSVDFIKRSSATQFDPVVVEALLQVLETHPDLPTYLQSVTEAHSDLGTRHTRDESAVLNPEQFVEAWHTYTS